MDITGSVSDDARLAGGEVLVAGSIGRNITAAGGSVTLAKGSLVSGNSVVGGGKVNFEGSIDGSSKIAAGELTIAGKTGKVETHANKIRLAAGAMVRGDFIYDSPGPALIEGGAAVSGKTSHARIRQPEKPKRAVWLYLVYKLAVFASTLAAGLAIIALFPHYSSSAVAALRKRPLSTVGMGSLVFFVMPLAIAGLFVTLIGIPLGLAVGTMYLASLYLARIFVLLWAGQTIFYIVGKNGGPGWAFVLGLVIYSGLTLVPLIGCLLSFVVMLFGLGAAALATQRMIPEQPAV